MTVEKKEASVAWSPRLSGIITMSTMVQYGLAAVTLVLVLAPLLPILYQSLLSTPLYDSVKNLGFSSYIKLFTIPNFLGILRNTVTFAVAATAISTVIGLVAAILLGRTDLPGRSFFYNVMLTPILVSELVLALGWFIVYGRAGYVTLWFQSFLGFQPWNLYSISGMALVAGIANAPMTFLYCLAAATQADASLENAARSCGAGPIRTLFGITLPLLRPAILYSLVITFTNGLEMLAIPLVLGGPERIDMLSTLLYTAGYASPRPDYGFVSATAVVLLAVIMVLL